jgi:hypothetical protein
MAVSNQGPTEDVGATMLEVVEMTIVSQVALTPGVMTDMATTADMTMNAALGAVTQGQFQTIAELHPAVFQKDMVTMGMMEQMCVGMVMTTTLRMKIIRVIVIVLTAFGKKDQMNTGGTVVTALGATDLMHIGRTLMIFMTSIEEDRLKVIWMMMKVSQVTGIPEMIDMSQVHGVRG